jgi:DNA-directed RNA polymerase subunit RPC12/RpoP
MAAWFQCTNCEARYQFEARQAGRAMACRACGFVFRVPPVPVSTVPHAETLPAGGGQWFLRFASGRQFGPVRAQVVEEWVREQRADGECLVCPEGGEEWFRVADVFPDLFAPEHAEVLAGAYDPLPPVAEMLPAAGLLELLPDHRELLTESFRSRHDEAAELVEKEMRRAMGAMSLTGVRSLILEDEDWDGPRREAQLSAEHCLVAELSAHGSTFYLVVPWGGMGRMAHEFFSILPGRLPHPVALRRGSEEEFGTGQWVGINGAEDDVVAMSARRSQENLNGGIEWQWFSRRRDYTMVQVWGVQAVPLGAEKFLHAIQTNPRGATGSDFGLLWYLERQAAFYRFARRLSIPDTHEPHVLFACGAGRLLVLASDRLQAGNA